MGSSMDTKRSRLLEAFKSRAFQTGHFVLASGKTSTYYIDSKKALFNSEVISLLGDVILDMTKALKADAMGGLEVGAIPLAAAVLVKYQEVGIPLEGFFVRKKPKDHGSKQRIEGKLNPGSRVIILDDVLTTGGSAMEAVQEVENAGSKVVAVVCIVDRKQGAGELFEGKYPFLPIFTIEDFGVEPPK